MILIHTRGEETFVKITRSVALRNIFVSLLSIITREQKRETQARNRSCVIAIQNTFSKINRHQASFVN